MVAFERYIQQGPQNLTFAYRKLECDAMIQHYGGYTADMAFQISAVVIALLLVIAWGGCAIPVELRRLHPIANRQRSVRGTAISAHGNGNHHDEKKDAHIQTR